MTLNPGVKANVDNTLFINELYAHKLDGSIAHLELI